MTGKHYAWHKRWTVSLETTSATHDTGLVMRFSHPPDGDGWEGQAENAQEIFEALAPKHGAGNAQQMLVRLAREAGEIWQRANAKR